VCATTPDLGSLAREVGGEQISLTVFAKGTEDPHFLEARPGFVKSMSQAQMFLLVGMELESAWVPAILQNARNSKVLPGARGFVDCSSVVSPLDLPAGPLDRSMGDVHPAGNPHYLLDPINGLAVARLIRDRLSEIRPQERTLFHQRYTSFRDRVAQAMVGGSLAARYDFEKLAILFEHGKLQSFLAEQGSSHLLGGWLRAMMPHFGVKAVADHNLWPYFSRRFGVRVMGFMEPKPGIAPTTKHLGELVSMMKAHGVKLILAAPYFDPRHARFLAERTSAGIARMAHQVGSVEEARDYLGMVDYNVREVLRAVRP
jgi:ABC-type Zn uptake system ZnuABC Zn-binding protein ZnuA